MRYRDINPPNEWGEAPDQGIAVTPLTEMYLFALLPQQGAEAQDRAPISGGRLVAAASAADARLVAAATEFMQETDQQPMPSLSHSSAFRDEKLYRVEQIDQRPVEAARGLIATEFDEQCQSFLSLPNPRR
ncbi:hypothetical protein ACFQ3K_00740 [Brucella gallinifaecis]|uniref:Uncharacterized protein n=1 Tax=Brucella gallinifaecis TaxID=215590 RepID=A0A502BMM6_9HYPH|nr:hypothetical protein [Brucella gallinifaecis]TPF74538.1 hypothetical protein FHY56_13795 [Brucella gallinifaecis]